MSTTTTTRTRSQRGTTPAPKGRAVPTPTQPPELDELAQMRKIAQDAVNSVQKQQEEIKQLRAQLTAQQPANVAVPVDPYAGKTTAELLAMVASGDVGAQQRLLAIMGGTAPAEEIADEFDEFEESGPDYTAMSEEDLMFAIVDAKRQQSEDLADLTAEWDRRKAGNRQQPAREQRDVRYGEFSAAEVREFLTNTATGKAICRAVKWTPGETGRLHETAAAAAVEAMREQRGSGAAPAGMTFPVQQQPATFTPTGGLTLTPPTLSSGPKVTGRGGQYSTDVDAYYISTANNRLKQHGRTIMDIVKAMSPDQWAMVSRGGSDVRNSRHGEPWEIPNLTDGPLAGHPCITTGQKGSDTNFAMGMAQRTAHLPQWTGGADPWTEGNPYVELARMARSRDGNYAPSQNMYERAARIVGRMICAGFAPGV